MKTSQLVLSSFPDGVPTKENFKIEEIELPDLKDGEISVQTVYVSVDPYQRGRMRDTKKNYFPSFKIGQPIDNSIVGRVMESKHPKFKPGDFVTGFLPFREHHVLNPDKEGAGIGSPNGLKNVNDLVSKGADPKHFLSCIGMVGLTAYFGLLELGTPKSGDTVLVSGAAGAVGSLVGQIAKLHGCRVIGIAGSTEKTDWITKELGFDDSINYKQVDNLSDAIEEKCPKGVDVYFDNVGGKTLEAALNNMNTFGRIVACGAISTYNDKNPSPGPSNLFMVVTKQLKMEGFLVGRWSDRFNEGLEKLTEWSSDGKIKTKETLFSGIEQIPDAFIGLFTGQNIGKMIIKLDKE